jgi:hypothetical protein
VVSEYTETADMRVMFGHRYRHAAFLTTYITVAESHTAKIFSGTDWRLMGKEKFVFAVAERGIQKAVRIPQLKTEH